jgi:hypothetical protein
MAEEKKRVTRDDVLGVLIKHAATPNDPDDADILTRFQQQEAEKAASGTSDDSSEEEEDTSSRSRSSSTQRGRA